eukprot:JP446655.1.p2 GENE.JP446655.1~~JP446655.1.p2  ORF type:complete len:289 (+),score=94.59 JP446655.1:35-868(+)
MPAPGNNKDKRLERHSGTGSRGLPKKDGAGGKGTWGKIGSEVDSDPIPASPFEDTPKALKAYLAEHKIEQRLHRILNDVAEKRPRFPISYIAKNLELSVPIDGPIDEDEMELGEYLEASRLEDVLDETMNRLVKERPNKPFQFICETLPLVEKLAFSEEGLKRVERGEPIEADDEPEPEPEMTEADIEAEREERSKNQKASQAAFAAEQDAQVAAASADKSADDEARKQNRITARRASDAEQARQVAESNPDQTKDQRQQIAEALKETEGKKKKNKK